jgi:hypothetical protein
LATPTDQLKVNTTVKLDGVKSPNPSSSFTFDGVATNFFTITVPASSTYVFNQTFIGAIERIFIKNNSGKNIAYKLDAGTTEYDLKKVAILSFDTDITFVNANTTAVIIEVQVLTV